MFMAGSEDISYFQSWFIIVQNSSESIRRSRITSQLLFPNHILGGGGQELRVKHNVYIPLFIFSELLIYFFPLGFFLNVVHTKST